MMQLRRCFSRVADSFTAAPAYELLWPRQWRGTAGQVPVDVGEEMERFSVSADVVNHPVFEELLRRSAEEYGYHHPGVIRIPCPVPDFRRLLHALRHGGRGLSDDVVELIDSLSPQKGD